LAKNAHWERKEKNPEDMPVVVVPRNRDEKKNIELTMSSSEFDRRWDEIRHRIDNKKEPLVINVDGVKYISFPVYKSALEE
jgi:hypothetical protein